MTPQPVQTSRIENIGALLFSEVYACTVHRFVMMTRNFHGADSYDVIRVHR